MQLLQKIRYHKLKTIQYLKNNSETFEPSFLTCITISSEDTGANCPCLPRKGIKLNQNVIIQLTGMKITVFNASTCCYLNTTKSDKRSCYNALLL